MSVDEQFTAKGQSPGMTLVGFQTRPGANIERGVDVTGVETGVVAHGKVAVEGVGTLFGVHSRGPTAVEAQGRTIGVNAQGPVGVRAQGETIGVKASGSTGVDAFGGKVGVLGIVKTPTGQIGVSGKGLVGVQGNGAPGGRFISGNRQPQLHLGPQEIVPGNPATVTAHQEFRPAGSQLPAKGKLGDLWLSQHKGGPARSLLWLCVIASRGKTNAKWAQVLLGNPLEGTKLPAAAPGEPEG